MYEDINNNEEYIVKSLPFLEADLVKEILDCSIVESFPKQTVLIREGQYVKHLPVVFDGIIKVYSQFDGKELLLYYIKSKQSCIVSFAAATYNQPSDIYAITESESKILLLPSSKIVLWTNKYPRFNKLFLGLYHQRYLDLLETVNQLVFKTLDQRLMSYLNNLSKETGSALLNIRHHEIARDLGSAREVVTRVIKKLEKEQKVIQSSNGIELLQAGD